MEGASLLKLERIYGPPGTGKTTRLLQLVESYLSQGYKASDIAYLAFTVKAAREAVERASEKFGLLAENFPGFRTIHSLAFRHLGLSTGQVLKRKHYSVICERLGFPYSGYVDLEEGQTSSALLGDRLLFMEGLARARRLSPDEQFEQSNEECSPEEFQLLREAVRQFKESHFLIDFNEMLERMLDVDPPTYKVLIVDEAQDLSNLQWEVIERLMGKAQHVHVAGDDDQAIFRWAGAAPERFNRLGGEATVLDQSWRIPGDVHTLAEELIRGVGDRQEKRYRPRNVRGSVEVTERWEDLPLESGDWLILGRNTYLLRHVQEQCLREGSGYVGKGGKLFVPEGFDPDHRPNVRISTIHGAKGSEADHVAVFSDMSYKTWDAMMNGNMDDELRTFYVAITRAKTSLTLIGPKTNNYFIFPGSL